MTTPLLPSQDERFVADSVQRFVDAEVRPRASAWEESRAVPPETAQALHELGLGTLLLDEARGGAGLGLAAAAAAVVELAKGDASLAWTVAAHNLGLSCAAAAGVDLEPYASGELFLSAALRIGRRSVAPTTFGPTHVALVGPSESMLLEASSGLGSPVERPLGLVSSGLSWIDDQASGAAVDATDPWLAGLVLASAVALGVGRSALGHAVTYALERRQFGRPIADFQGLQFRLADRATELEASEALLRLAVVENDIDRARGAVRLTTGAASRLAHDAIQVYGGIGFVREYPVERLLRDAKALEGLVVRPRLLSDEAH